jgi:hypothetical protein
MSERTIPHPLKEHGWRAGGTEFRWTVGILLALFAVYQVAYLAIVVARPPPGPVGDSFYLWVWARFLIEHPAVELYDPAKLATLQLAYGMDPTSIYPFAYPPTMMLLLLPWGLLPYKLALGLTVGGSLLFYLWATVGREWRSPALFAALVAPTTTLTIVAGQTGFLTGALMIGGFRLAERHPVCGGMLLGLMTYKPQLGLLIPVALAAARLWRAMIAASVTVLVLVAATSLAFGSTIWLTWIGAIRDFAGLFATQAGVLRHLMPTVAANLLQLSLGPAAVRIGQTLATLATVVVVWGSFRRGATPLAIAALLVGTFLATPYALVYDMPIIATAVIWLVIERYRTGGLFRLGEVAVLVVAMFFPCLMLMPQFRWPLSAVALALLLGAIMRRIVQVRQGA